MKHLKNNIIWYLSITAVLFSINTMQSQTTYYVDASGGNDINAGTTTTTAWKTLAKINSKSSTFLPGDIVLLKKGEVWKGQRLYSVNHASGTINNPITYSSYGTGAKPIINIIVDKSPIWTNEGENIWSTPTDDYARFFLNDIELLRANNLTYFGLYGTDYYVSQGELLVYSVNNPTTDTYSWAKYSIAIKFEGASYINFNDIDVQGGSNHSLEITNNIGWKINNCNLGFNAGYGCRIKNSSNILISNCIFDSNSTVDQSQIPSGIPSSSNTGCHDGLFITTGSQNITIENCFFKNWGHASFGANTTNSTNKISNIIFRNNELTSPDILYGGRLAYSGYVENSEFYNNYIHDISVSNQLGGNNNHFHHNIINRVLNSPLKYSSKTGVGILIQNYNILITNNIIENNLITNTQNEGFKIYSINFDSPNEVSGNIFRNNILYNCGTDENIAIQFHKDQEGQHIYNNIIENNLIYNENSTQTCKYQFNGTVCDISTFNNLDGDINNNIADNPLFIDVDNNNFHLQEMSSAINAGTTPIATIDWDENPIPFPGTLPDIGLFEYQVQTTNHPPTATNVTILGTPEIGQTLTLNYNFNDEDGDTENGSIIAWSTPTIELQRGTSNTFVVPENDPNGNSLIGETICAWIHPIDIHDLEGESAQAENCWLTITQDCSGASISNLEISTNVVSNTHFATITWEGNPNATTWLYVHELDSTGPQHPATGNTYTYSTLGANYTFTVFVQGENNCDEPTSMEFSTFNSTASISSNKINNIFIYPNPATRTLTIIQNQLELKNYTITNMIGQKVASDLLNNQTIDISKLENGIYFIELFNDKQSITQKFIKQ